MEPDTAGSGAFLKIRRNRLSNLLLQITQVLSLRRDAARAIRRVPGGYEPARLLVMLDLQSNLIHDSKPIPSLASPSSIPSTSAPAPS